MQYPIVEAPNEGRRDMRRLRIAVLAAAIIAGLFIGPGFHPACAEPLTSIRKTFYAVDGMTATQIRQALDRNSPVRQNGKTFDAYTRWNVEWQFYWNSGGDGSCRITTVATTVGIHFTLPRLQANENRPPNLERRWSKYISALVTHEEAHADFGIDAAREVEQRLSQMDGRPSCRQLESDANALAREIIARYLRMEDRYDAETDHGAREGARFP